MPAELQLQARLHRMKTDSTGTTKTGNGESGQRWSAALASRRAVKQALEQGDGSMDSGARSRRMDPAAAHPLSELLECPSNTGSVLTASARNIDVDAGELVFRQSSACEGLYLVVQGQLLRRTERMETRISLGLARPGDLVELAAALGDLRHTYSLAAQTPSALLMLPVDALQKAFESYPPLRMRLLEELAREVSRGYLLCGQTWTGRTRRGSSRSSAA
jgi:hypothetical protein